MISLIAVIGKNNELGYQNKLLWHLPEDLKHFKAITNGHTVVMGRKTFESIGRALPSRKNIIVTRDKNFTADGCEIIHDFKDFLEKNKKSNDEIFIIGGAEIYKQALSCAHKLYLTKVDDSPIADVYFPDYSEFKKIIKKEAQESISLKYSFIELIK